MVVDISTTEVNISTTKVPYSKGGHFYLGAVHFYHDFTPDGFGSDVGLAFSFRIAVDPLSVEGHYQL